MRQKSLFVRAVGVCLFLGLSAVFSYAQDEKITEGSLRVIDAKGNPAGLCPLKNTDVKAEISGFLSRVTVTQTFQNPFNESIEAIYSFPLPNDAAVDDMTMNIGTRTIKGKIMERKEAQAAYDKAKQEGKTAALLEQQRPNIFTQSVGNITPNAEIKIVISYVETLKYADDIYEFHFPMTVGERYIPLSVGEMDAAKISPKSKARPGHTVSMEVSLEAGVVIQNLSSVTHEIETQQFSASRFVVKLKNENEIPNRDFVLRYKTAGQKIEDVILTHKEGGDGFFTLILQPPDKVFPADTMPKEIVFVLDTSGSMDGFPIKKAKEAMKLTLDNLNPFDTFNLITFAGETRILFDQPVPATKENLAKARKMLNDVDSNGGTEMMKAIKASLEPSDSNNHVRIVCFMTDGHVGNEAEIIAEVQKHPNARIFAFGIGDSVNRHLLDEISREGRGEVEYVGLNDNGSAAARKFYERVKNPLLTDISLEFQGIETAEVLPRVIPDLFDAKPVTVVGRYSRGGNGKIIMRGKMQGQVFQREIAINFPEQNEQNGVLATLWARRKVADITRRDYAGLQKNEMRQDLQATLTNLGLEFKILTPFTSFVAVDEQIVTDGTQLRRVEIPVAAPNKGEFIENYWQRNDNGNSGGGGGGGGVSATGNISGVTAMVEVTTVSSVSMDATDTKIDTNITKTTYFANPPVKGGSFQLPLSIAGGITQTNESRVRFQQGLISSNGQRPTSNNFSVDGLGANLGIMADETSLSENAGSLPALTASGGTNSLMTFDAAQEITVKTMSSAKEQRVAGAHINFVSAAGTNTFHGSLFETFGSEFLNANDFFANSRGFGRSPSRLNQFGGTLGGFIVKDKAWFSGGYEGLRLHQTAFSVSEVPNLFSRNNAAPEIRPLVRAFPLPNGKETSNGFAEFSANYVNPAAHDIFGFRVDTQPKHNLRIGGRYNFADSSASLRGDRNISLNTWRKSNVRTNSFSVWSSYTPNSTTVLNGYANFSRNSIGQRFSVDDFGGADVSAPIFTSPFDFLKYDLAGKNSAIAVGSPIEADVSQFYASGTVDRISGNHVFTFGGDFRRLSLDVGAQPLERSVLFAGITPNPGATASRIVEISRILPQKPTLNNFSLFVQDVWRLTSRLNLNFGLRWDADTSPKIDPVNLNFQDAASQIPDNYKNFAPRVGFAFDVLGSGKTVIRGGGGLYYDYGNSAASLSFANSFPYAGGNFARNIFFGDAPTNPLNPLLVFAKDLKTPRTWQFFTEYEQQLARNHTFSAMYAASFGRNLFLTRTFYDADPTFNFVRLTDNSAASNYHAFQSRLTHRFAADLFLDIRYTFAKSTDNFSPDLLRENNFVNADLTGERGVSDFDVRHQFNIFGVYPVRTPFENGWKKFLTEDWTISAFVSARTAFPIDVNYARIGDFGKELLRPDLISNVPLYLNENGIKQINPNAFAIPNEYRQGLLGRNSLRGFPLFQLDLGLQRRFRFGNETSLNLEIRAFNLLNNTNFADMDGSLGTRFSDQNFLPNSYFGRTSETFGSSNFTPFYLYGGARTIQLSAKFVF